MGWTAPRDWTVGEVVTEAMMDTHVKDNLRYLKGLDGAVTLSDALILPDGAGYYLHIPILTTAQRDALTPTAGMLIYNSTTTQFNKYENAAWRSDLGFNSHHGDLSGLADDDHTQYQKESVLTTEGDIVYATAASTWARLPIGTASQLLRTNAGATAPEWYTRTELDVVRKTADETVSNSTALQNDDELLFAMGANEHWLFFGFLAYNSTAVADFKLTLSAPEDAAARFSASGYQNIVDGGWAGSVSAFDGSGGWKGISIHGLVETAATSGNLQLQWAQSNAEVSDTTVRKDSWLMIAKMA